MTYCSFAEYRRRHKEEHVRQITIGWVGPVWAPPSPGWSRGLREGSDPIKGPPNLIVFGFFCCLSHVEKGTTPRDRFVLRFSCRSRRFLLGSTLCFVDHFHSSLGHLVSAARLLFWPCDCCDLYPSVPWIRRGSLGLGLGFVPFSRASALCCLQNLQGTDLFFIYLD